MGVSTVKQICFKYKLSIDKEGLRVDVGSKESKTTLIVKPSAFLYNNLD